jgi:hypothetical protein
MNLEWPCRRKYKCFKIKIKFYPHVLRIPLHFIRVIIWTCFFYTTPQRLIMSTFHQYNHAVKWCNEVMNFNILPSKKITITIKTIIEFIFIFYFILSYFAIPSLFYSLFSFTFLQIDFHFSHFYIYTVI